MNFETDFHAAPEPHPVTAIQSPPQKPWRRRLFRWVLGISVLLNLSTCLSRVGVSEVGEEEFPPVAETLAFGTRSAPTRVALLRFEGVLMRQPGGFWGTRPDPVTSLLREIQAATVDESVRAIFLEISSPGGGVTASDEIYQALRRFRESRPDRRLVALVGDMAASGGYYIALPADHIVAQPTSVVGSVGVLLGAINLHQLAERLGVEDVTITSGSNKALLSSFRPVEDAHRDILQAMVDSLYHRFRDLVLEHRPFDAAFADANGLLDGRVFSAMEALNFGLIDEIGYGPEAREALRRLLGEDDLGFYALEYSPGFRSLLQARSHNPLQSLLQTALQADNGFLYLWRP